MTSYTDARPEDGLFLRYRGLRGNVMSWAITGDSYKARFGRDGLEVRFSEMSLWERPPAVTDAGDLSFLIRRGLLERRIGPRYEQPSRLAAR